MPNEFSVRLVPAKMAGVVSPRGGGEGGKRKVKSGKMVTLVSMRRSDDASAQDSAGDWHATSLLQEAAR